MKYLVDTNVISELRKGSRCDGNVQAWFDRTQDEQVFISVLTLGEIRKGIERVRRRDPMSAGALEAWLVQVRSGYSDRIVEIDAEIADRWGRPGVPDPVPAVDGLLVATALVHGMTLVTRNVADVERSGIPFLNPFEG